jgi:hypothetical protein
MCNCGAKRRAARGVTVTVPTTTRAVQPVVAPPAPAPSRLSRFRRGRRAPEPGPTFHLPIVDTKVWGPRLWTVLHTASVALPCGDVWVRLVEELKMGLPCPDCTGHYTAWVTAQPVSATTDMGAWFLALHNDVNRRVGAERKVVVGGWTCEAMTAAYTGRMAEARAALEALNGVIGAATWTTLDAILVAGAATGVTGLPDVSGNELGPA